MDESPQLLTVEQFAKRANIGRSLAYELIAAGAIRSVRIGRLRRIPVDELERYVRQLLAEQNGAA